MFRVMFAALTALAIPLVSSASVVAFDSMSNAPFWNVPSAPNAWVGEPITVASGNSIVGLDIVLTNNAGLVEANKVILNLSFWSSATLARTGGAAAFSGLLGSESIQFGAMTFANMSRTSFQDATSPGQIPGILLPQAIDLASSTFAISLNWQYDVGQGVVSKNNFVTAGRYGAAPTVGSNPLPSPDGGYYRSTAGNYIGADWRTGGSDSNLAIRVYTVPEPASAVLFAIVAVHLLIVRARRQEASA